MDDLFRFLTLRPAQTPSTASLDITTSSQYQKNLAAARLRPGGNAWNEYVVLTTQFLASPSFISDSNQPAYAKAYASLRAALTPVPAAITQAQFNGDIQAAFNLNVQALAAAPQFAADAGNIYDSIVAFTLQPASAQALKVSLPALVSMAQIVGLVKWGATAQANDVTVDAVSAQVDASVVLPSNIFPVVPGVIHPVGVADLLVVKQHITRYELGEISTVENLLAGEMRDLVHKHSLTTEQTTTTDSSTTTETSNELTTDERFALHRETAATTAEDTSVKGGLSVSAKYGTTLQVNANADASYNNAKTDATKNSSDYAKDVTMRAASTVTQTFRQTIVSRVLETLEEDSERKLDNTTGPKNICGVYQWVDKIYLAQVYNYGKRLQYDMIVPEPAAMMLDAATTGASKLLPQKPDNFTLTPAQLSTNSAQANYYGNFLAKYGVTGIDAPPLDTVTVAKTFCMASGDKAQDMGAELEVPAGYRATQAFVQGQYNTSVSNNGVNIWVANQQFNFGSQHPNSPGTQPLNLEAASIPVIVESFGTDDYAFSVEIQCEPTIGAMDAWLLKTHSSIVSAWQRKISDYNDAMAKLNVQNSTSVPLGNAEPDINRKVEQRELKRCAIQMLYNPSLYFNDIQSNAQGLNIPGPDPAKAMADGKVIRFFEQAFEWENMMYVFYPYFWGRRDNWYSKALAQNADPLFADFLNSGAARLVLPVRPTFEGLLRYYLLTGQVWGGGDMPNITDPTYLPITEEIKELDNAPGDEVPQGPPWEVRLPTSLIKLRGDDSKPEWDRASGLPPAETTDWVWTPKPPDAW